MAPYDNDPNGIHQNFENNQAAVSSSFSSQMVKVYGWMFFGLVMTAVISWYTMSSSLKYLALNPIAWIGLALAELGVVWYLSSRVFTMKYENAAAAFVVYSGLNGLTLSVIFYRYSLGSIFMVFLITAFFFGFISVYGLITKQDLTNWGPLLIAGVFGIILATVVNFFLRSDTFSLIISYIGVAVFLGLTAYDSQKLKKIHNSFAGTDKERNIAIFGALTLYLDLINLFLFILRLLGKRR